MYNRFLQAGAQTYLENPTWEKLQQSTECTIVFRSCCEVFHSKEIFEGCPFRDIPLAVHVPMNPEEMEGAVTRMSKLYWDSYTGAYAGLPSTGGACL